MDNGRQVGGTQLCSLLKLQLIILQQFFICFRLLSIIVSFENGHEINLGKDKKNK